MASAAFARMLFESAATGAALLDRELRYVRINETLAEMNGQPPAAHLGRTVREVLPAVAADLLVPVLERVLRTGEPLTDLAFAVHEPGNVRRHFLASYWPVRGDGGAVTGVAAFVAERTPAEAALQESESRLRRVAESGIVGLFSWETDGRITDANDAFLTMLGYTRDDLEAGRLDWRSLTPPEWAASDEVHVRELLATGRHGQYAKEYFARDGRRVPVVITSAFLEGTMERGVCVCLDDTARRAAEARLGRVLMQTPAAVGVLFGPDHVVTSVNEMFLRLLGRRDYIGRPAREGAPELVEQGFLALMDEVYRTGRPYHGRAAPLVWDRDGDGVMREGFFDFVYQPLFDAAGAVDGILVFAVDVTEQVRARREVERLLAESERARAEAEALTARLRHALDEREGATARAEATARSLWSTEARLRFAMDAAALGAWDLDLVTGRAWRSLRHDAIFGYPEGRAEWTYQDFLAHVHPEDRARVDERFGGALASGTAWDFTCRIRRASDGAERWIAARGEPVADASGRPVRVVGVVRDVTDQQLAERAIREARDAAEAANRAKGEFLAVMSHELRTPLNAIAGYTQLLELGLHGPVTPDQREALARIQRSQQHLLGLINEVLNYARLESGAVTYELEPVRVADVVSATVPLVEPQRAAKDIALDVRLPEHAGRAPIRVLADSDKLEQILLNLLSNAVRFTPRGGRITIELTGETDAEGRVKLRVRDTGVGIPADKLEAIFEPFVQIGRTLRNPGEGTGLGLAISRDLARGMGGDLAAESAPGAGSTFTLTLPRA